MPKITRKIKNVFVSFCFFGVVFINFVFFRVFFKETKNNIKNNIITFIDSKTIAFETNYKFLFRNTQKFDDIVSKLDLMIYYKNLYYYTVYVSDMNSEKIILKKSSDIFDKKQAFITENKFNVFYYNEKYFVVYFIDLNLEFNFYTKNKNKVRLVCIEKINFNSFKYRHKQKNKFDLLFHIKIKNNVDVKVYFTFYEFIALYKNRFLTINLLFFIFSISFFLLFVFFNSKIENIIKEYLLAIKKDIEDTRILIKNDIDKLTYQNKLNKTQNFIFENKNKYKLNNKLLDVIYSLEMLLNTIFLSINKIRDMALKQNIEEIKQSKKTISVEFEKAFKRVIPEINLNLEINGFRIDIASHIEAANIATADGVFCKFKDNKIFMCVYDVSGHSIFSSFKAITMQTELNRIFYNKNNLDVKTILKKLWENSFHLGLETVDGVVFSIDFYKKIIEIFYFGTSFFVYFDKTKCYNEFKCNNKTDSLQFVENDELENVKAYIDSVSVDTLNFEYLSRIVILTDGFTQAKLKNKKMINNKQLNKCLNFNNKNKTSSEFIENFLLTFDKSTLNKIEDDRSIVVLTII